jgi:hypothetical protein
MAKYMVNVSSAPEGHDVPPLLLELGTWLGAQDHGALGWFDGLMARAIDKEWSEEHADRLRAAGFAFLTLGEGSTLALLKTGAKTPPAVVLLDSEGDRRTVANSLEEFLALWAKGKTDIGDLDEEESAPGRRALGAWLKEKKIKAPKAASFDFQAWLDTGIAVPPAPHKAEATKRVPTEAMTKLGPKMGQLASIMGMRADAPEVVAYVTKVLGTKLPQSTTDMKTSATVGAPQAGIEMQLSHEIFNDGYPPIHKTAKSFIPYVSFAWIRERIGEPVLGVSWKATTEEEITNVLGPPTRRVHRPRQNITVPYWIVELDTGAGVSLEVTLTKGINVTMAVTAALALEQHVDLTTGLFLGWAATHGLLDETRFAAHADLLAAVMKRTAKGSDLMKIALPRGLWSDHLKDDLELRTFAFGWFKNLSGCWITGDLKEVFGKRPGPHGHDQPSLDDDTWDAVDKASTVFGARFEKWLSR